MAQETIYILSFIAICFFLEALFPREKLSFSFAILKEDLFWFFTNHIFLNFLFGLVTFNLGLFLMKNFTGFFDLALLSKSNVIVEFLSYIIIFDFISYTGHYLLHKVPFLWNFHKLHHSITKLNPLSAFRHSIFEKVYYSFYFAVFTSFFSVSKTTYFFVVMTTFAICILQHSRIKISALSFLDNIFITPHNHMYHHSKKNYLNKGQNFGFIFVFWDKLFKTFYVDDNDNIELGLNDRDFPKSLARKFFYPL